jgi:hypothetical protein
VTAAVSEGGWEPGESASRALTTRPTLETSIRNAAGDAARDSTGDAAQNAVGNAAWDSTRNTAGNATRDAAKFRTS